MARMESTELRWFMNCQKEWYSIQEVNILPKFMSGVYVIFCKPILPNGNRTTVAFYVGQSGDCIRGRIEDHIKKKKYRLGYRFTFAKLEKPDFRDGVERFLYDCYDPVHTEKAPNIAPIAVNLPFVEYLKGWQFWVIQEALTHNHTQVLKQFYERPHSPHQLA